MQFCGCCWERTNPQGAVTEAYQISEYLPTSQKNMESTRKCLLAMWPPTPNLPVVDLIPLATTDPSVLDPAYNE